MARRRQGPYARQAALQALLRFGPETSGLQELMRQAQSNFQSSTAAAQGSAQNIISEIGRARPEVRDVYKDAGLAQARAASVTQNDVSQLGDVANSVKAAIGLEGQMSKSRIAESRASALTDLSQQRVAAQTGAQWAQRQAQGTFVSDVAKILERKQSLGAEQGAFTALTTQELRKAAQQRADEFKQLRISQRGQTKRSRISARQSERNSLRSSGIDPETGRYIPGGKLDPAVQAQKTQKERESERSKRFVTPTQQLRAHDTFTEARTWAARLKAQGLNRHEVAQALLQGRDEAAIKDPSTGKPVINPDGTPKTRIGIPRIESEVLLTTALDDVYDGEMSRVTERKLRALGYRVRPFGIKRRSQRKRRTYSPSGPGSDAAQRSSGRAPD